MKKIYQFVSLTVLVVFLGFSSVTYTSCERDDAALGCDTLKCLNFGVCQKGVCSCPTGYDGYDCGVALADKFISNSWAAQETVIGSDNGALINTTSSYNIRTRPGYTATSFFIDSVNGDNYKSNVLCEIKSPTTFEVAPGFTPINNPTGYQIMGGTGNIDTMGTDKMSGMYYRKVTDVFGTHTDTLQFTFTQN